ncbi:KAP family P-loop NTPase fold protein [Piscirickettsia salmonis]|uniref:KAP family P-loop NTPase fold protein n=1 Tax=Piscirickettsia salmonis TaxID=1238 RepID=UPI0007C8F3A8|nr:KAP family P-loop domain protein [Piscirickettsiaceae bacterium NZ-RLO1]
MLDNETKTPDTLNRGNVADRLVKLIKSDIEISPLLIDGLWGTGKTTLAKLIIDRLEDKKIKSVYIDAFKYDHTNDPLGMLVAQIANAITEPKDDSKAKKFINASIPAVKYGIKRGAKALTSYVLRADCDDIAEEFKDAITEGVDDGVRSILESHQKADENINALKAALVEATSNETFVVIIDELDRCKPDFAVSILEKVKHIFATDNVKFVLVANVEQIKASVCHAYGNSIDATRYLDKFIKFFYKLPVVHDNAHTVKEHLKTLLSNDSQISALKGHLHLQTVEQLIDIHNHSLREVEDFVGYLRVYNLLNEDIFNGDPLKGATLLRMFSVYLYCFHRDLSDQIISGDLQKDSLYKVLGFESKSLDSGRQKQGIHMLAAIFATNIGSDEEIQKEIEHWGIKYIDSFDSFVKENNEYIQISENAIECLMLSN